MAQTTADTLAWFHLIRNSIAFPLLALNYAVCGVQILCSAFYGSSANIDLIKKKIVYGTAAMFILCFLPSLIMAAKDMFQSTAWQPPSPPPLETRSPNG